MHEEDLRIREGVDRGDPFTIEVDGEAVRAYAGETIATALLAAGKRVLQVSPKLREPRGLFCGMGVCYGCRMIINGQPNVRACVTLAEPGCHVRTQEGLAAWKEEE
jgi:sarcosine oxidase subunit alpha